MSRATMTNDERSYLADNPALRTPCEIYSRVMGYHRPIAYWNPGKQQEWEDRRMFMEPETNTRTGVCE